MHTTANAVKSGGVPRAGCILQAPYPVELRKEVVGRVMPWSLESGPTSNGDI